MLPRLGYRSAYVVDNYPDPEVQAICATYCYIAGLYGRGVLDVETLFAKDAPAFAIGFYAVDPIVRDFIATGTVTESVLWLVRDAPAMVKRSRALSDFYPQLKDYEVVIDSAALDI